MRMNFYCLKRELMFSNKFISAFLILLLEIVPIYVWGHPERVGSLITEQQAAVKGIVVDQKGEALIGVNVMEKGTANGTITDIDGNFNLTVSKVGAILQFSYIGYNTAEIASTAVKMKVVLEEASQVIQEVIVVGYGSQKKESVVGSIAQVKGDKLKSKGAVSNITDALSGTMPGVTVMTTNGNPGGGGEFGQESTILIRGMNTWNNAQPLILVDGVERNMNDVDVNEIENFSVLKDASATAVFGVKGANGVILITTKRGQKGKAKVSLEANFAIKSLSKVEKPVGAYEGLVARNFAIVNELPRNGSQYWQYYTSNRLLEKYRTRVDPERYPDTDWRDVMLRDAAYASKYNLNISGGTDFVKYFTSAGYVYEGDIFDTTQGRGYKPEFRYDRFNFRTNLDFTLTKTTSFKVNLSGYYGKQQTPGGGIHNMWYGVYKYDPAGAVPVYSDGIYGADYSPSDRIGFNSLYYMNTAGSKVYNRTSVTSDFELKQDLEFITKGLSVKGRFSYDNYFTSLGAEVNDSGDNYIRKIWNETKGAWDWYEPATGTDGFDFFPNPLGYTSEYLNDGQAENTRRNMYYEVSINYNRRFGKHNVGALALFSRQEATKGSAWPSKREDWVARITYDYDGKYLFEANGAYNGSEKFGPKHRFDFFPSLALGWRISEEAFMKKYLPFISNLKVKYSIGTIGNDMLNNVGQWPFVTTWNAFGLNDQLFPGGSFNAGRYPNFGSLNPTVSNYPIMLEGTPGNPDLRWEKATKQNIGLEFGFFDNLITGNVDIFKDSRKDMLIGAAQRSVPDFFGQTPPAANIGKVKSYGLEFDIKAQKRFGDFDVWASYNWTLAKNKIEYKEDPELLPFYQKAAGYAIGQVKSQVVSGLVQSWDEMYTGVMFENSSTNNNMTPGAYRMIDYNGNGIIDSNDGCPYAYSQYPQNTYGFSLGGEYKGISLNLQFYGIYNVSINAYEFNDEFAYNSAMIYPSLIENTWTPEYGNKDASYRGLQHIGRTPTGSSVIYDGSFLRLKSVELSYTIPKKLVEKLSLDNIRLYVNGNNLFFWSKLPVDIEGSNFTMKSYPNTKQFNFGANVVF